MKLSFLCSDALHPVNHYINRWADSACDDHEVSIVRRKMDLPGGDILFLISCAEILDAQDKARYRECLVLHASDLPLGRGWSPHIWQILQGAQEIILSLLEVDDRVDAGRIWKKVTITVPKDALWNEINEQLFNAEIELIDFAIGAFGRIAPQPQRSDVEPTYFRRRTPVDSQIDPEQSIVNLFNKIRVCDPARFPAFFELHGYRYKISLEKMDESPDTN